MSTPGWPSLLPVVSAAGLPALVAVAMCAATTVLLDLDVRGAFYGAAFAGTFLVYFADRAAPFSPEDVANHRRLRAGKPLVFAGYSVPCVVLALTVPQLQLETIIACALIGLLGSAYVLPIGGMRLKQFGLIKPLVVAAGWTFGAVVLPVIEGSGATRAGALMITALALYRLAYLLPNLLLGDLRDVRGDLLSGIRTPAARAGGRSVVYVAVAVSASTLAGGIALAAWSDLPSILALDAAGMIPMTALALASRRDPSAAGDWLDAVMLWPAVIVLAR